MDQPTFLALLLFPDETREPVSILLPVVSARPAVLLHASTTFEGVQAVDVFRLADASSWPEAAAYLYEKTVPGTVRDASTVEQVLTPDD
ncbi:hypothetical protein [Leifsonia sp. SIMBA_070]|uniref:hypothetical protein n=1 Tax=Leifsonia sp. SIMBA_070 TaxID=3085810 RepID=UPI003977E587